MEPVAGGSAAKYIAVTKAELVEWLKDCEAKTFQKKCDYLAMKLKSIMGSDDLSEESHQSIKNFLEQYKKRWSAASRNKAAFHTKNRSWLESQIQFCDAYSHVQKDTWSMSRGRPQAEFLTSSERSKRRKTKQLRSEFTPEELTYAAQMQLRSEGKLEAARVIKDVVFSTPTRAKKYKRAYAKSDVLPFSADEALSLFIDAKLTKFQYNLIRNVAKEHNSNLYPNYESITLAKTRCYPNHLNITEDTAEAPLQSLMDHTVSRLFESLKEVFHSLRPEEVNNLYLIAKWGYDGSSGMSQYKQKFSDPTMSDANVFLTSMVPIQLVNGDPNSRDKLLIWQNPRPSSDFADQFACS